MEGRLGLGETPKLRAGLTSLCHGVVGLCIGLRRNPQINPGIVLLKAPRVRAYDVIGSTIQSCGSSEYWLLEHGLGINPSQDITLTDHW